MNLTSASNPFPYEVGQSTVQFPGSTLKVRSPLHMSLFIRSLKPLATIILKCKHETHFKNQGHMDFASCSISGREVTILVLLSLTPSEEGAHGNKKICSKRWTYKNDTGTKISVSLLSLIETLELTSQHYSMGSTHLSNTIALWIPSNCLKRKRHLRYRTLIISAQKIFVIFSTLILCGFHCSLLFLFSFCYSKCSYWGKIDCS